MVRLYVADVSKLPDPKECPEWLNQLDTKRREKTLRYRQEKDRKQSLGAGLLLKKIFDEYDVNIEETRYGGNGKPEVEGICFNLSHSGNIVVCAVSDKPVGCDVEKICEKKEELKKIEGIADRFFTENEVRYLQQFVDDMKIDEFYRLWTMKESYMKMTGEGMSLALDKFEFVIGDKIKVYREGEACNCHVKEYDLKKYDLDGYKLTVCAMDKEFEELFLVKKYGKI